MEAFALIRKRNRMRTREKKAGTILMGLLVSALVLITFPAWSADYYIAQSATGNNNATSCANAKAISYLTGSWSGKIAAGDTVHLCGAFRGTADSNMLTVGASGTAGKPITIKFEDGAYFTAPYWSYSYGAIYVDAKNYVVIDGGTNGYIEASANGTALANNKNTRGVYSSASSNIEVKNLHINNLYVHKYGADNQRDDCTGACPVTATGIYFAGGGYANIHDNTISYCVGAIQYSHSSAATYNNVSIHDNTTTKTNWGLSVAVQGGAILSNLAIFGNDITPGSNFNGQTTDRYHTDGIFIRGAQSDHGTITELDIYNNYVHGEVNPEGGSSGWVCTSFLYIDTVEVTGLRIFNNILDMVSGKATGGVIDVGNSVTWHYGADAPLIANNTIIGYLNGSSGITHFKDGGTATIKNNIIINTNNAIRVSGVNAAPLPDNNLYYNNSRVAAIAPTGGSYTFLSTLANLQAYLGGCAGTDRECNGITVSPDLNADYTPKTSSPVVGAGVNLTSLGITALNCSKNGVARPATGPWTIGANAYTNGLSAPVLKIVQN